MNKYIVALLLLAGGIFMTKRASAKGLDYIRQFEEFRADRYLDIAGKPTIGYGHLITEKDGDIRYVTKEQAEIIFRKDVADAEEVINTLVKVPLNQNQYDALTSFVFNLGAGNFSESTMLQKLNAGDYVGAANEFPRWSYAGGEWVKGLHSRRLAEQKTFMA